VKIKIQLPDGFLDEEVRNGYTISCEMKKVWAVELDLLCEFDRICKEHHISYIADGGTLLGAIRHNGFIPWDDDIDVGMLRSEYEKLNAIASTEFHDPYFWQTEETDPGSLRGHAQLRNSDTTGILYCEQDRRIPFNQGIFIDVFQFDDSITDQKKLEEQFRNIVKYKQMACFEADLTIRYSYDNLKQHSTFKHRLKMNVLHTCLKLFHINLDYKVPYQKFLDECIKFKGSNFGKVADYVLPITIVSGSRDKNCFLKTVEHEFEFIKIPVPVDYDSALKQTFGSDYMVMKRNNSNHGGVLFDTEVSYKDYL